MATFTDTTITETYQYAIDAATDQNTHEMVLMLGAYLDRLDRRMDEMDPAWWSLSDRMELTDMRHFALQLEYRTQNEIDAKPVLAYRMDYLSGSASEWYCPTCHAELEDPESGTDHIRYVPITDAGDIPIDTHGLPKQCDADCGRYLDSGKTIFELADIR